LGLTPKTEGNRRHSLASRQCLSVSSRAGCMLVTKPLVNKLAQHVSRANLFTYEVKTSLCSGRDKIRFSCAA
jgi:hypothetical protein